MKKSFFIEETKYNSEKTVPEFQTFILFNHIYQHFTFHKYLNKNDNIISTVTVKIQGLQGTKEKIITNTISNIDINLKPMFL